MHKTQISRDVHKIFSRKSISLISVWQQMLPPFSVYFFFSTSKSSQRHFKQENIYFINWCYLDSELVSFSPVSNKYLQQTISPENYSVPNFEFVVNKFELNSFDHEYAAYLSECFTSSFHIILIQMLYLENDTRNR